MVLTGRPVSAASRPIANASATRDLLASPVAGGSTLASVVSQQVVSQQEERTAMASRKRAATVRQLQAAEASPSKVGQALGVHGINIAAFIAVYNTRSAAQRGL